MDDSVKSMYEYLEGKLNKIVKDSEHVDRIYLSNDSLLSNLPEAEIRKLLSLIQEASDNLDNLKTELTRVLETKQSD